jgi:hypothetical protein
LARWWTNESDGAPIFLQAAEKDPYASLRSIASRQRTSDVRFRSSILRAPRLWIFLSSLQEVF